MDCRVDKYLWVVRIFKTRSIATDACKSKKVLIDNSAVKPSRSVKVGDTIEIKQMPIIRTFNVLDIPKSRLSAKFVKDYLIETTPEGEFLKLKLAKDNYIHREKGTGRPTKKDRRILDGMKNRLD